MLQSMRELAKSLVFKTLMMLLIVSFGIWGIGDMFRGNPAQRTVASVGNIDIPVQELERRFQMEMPYARKVFGDDLTVTRARQIGVLDRTLHMMMEEYAFDQEAKRLNIDVSREALLKKIASEPKFRDKDGKFNTEMWHRALRQVGLTEQAFFDIDGRETARQMIITSVTSNAKLPQIMIDTLYQARGAKRVVEVLSMRNDSIKDVPQAKDEELQTYYKDHENDFVAPEYRGLTIASLATANLSSEITVSDEEVQAAYKERAAEMEVPETRDLIQIVLQDEAKAKEISDAAQAAKNLSVAAKAKNITPISMNKIDEKAILPELFTTVFAMEEDQTSTPVKTSLGWHVVQVKKIYPGGVKPFEQAKDELRKILQEERVGDLMAKKVNQIDDALASGQSLEDVADTLKLRLIRFASLDAKGEAADKKPVKDLLAKDILLPAAFSLGSGETSQVLDDGQGTYYVVRADQITPSQTRPFEEVKKQVETAWLEEQLYEKAKVVAEEMANEIRSGKTITSYASRPGVEVRLSKAISLLGDTDKDIPQISIPEILAMKKGDVTTAALDGKQYILRLADIVPVDPKRPEASRVKITDDLKEKLPHNIIAQYATELRSKFPPSVNEDILASLKSRSAEDPQ